MAMRNPITRTLHRSSQGVFSHLCLRKASAADSVITGLAGSAGIAEECKASRNPHLYTVVVLALATGARKMELVSLRWSDADLKRGLLTFHETKNGERRTPHLW